MCRWTPDTGNGFDLRDSTVRGASDNKAVVCVTCLVSMTDRSLQ